MGFSKGYGFVTFYDVAVAKRVIALGQTGTLYMNGRKINVNTSKPLKRTSSDVSSQASKVFSSSNINAIQHQQHSFNPASVPVEKFQSPLPQQQIYTLNNDNGGEEKGKININKYEQHSNYTSAFEGNGNSNSNFITHMNVNGTAPVFIVNDSSTNNNPQAYADKRTVFVGGLNHANMIAVAQYMVCLFLWFCIVLR